MRTGILFRTKDSSWLMDAKFKVESIRLQSSVFSRWAFTQCRASPASPAGPLPTPSPLTPLKHQQPPAPPIHGWLIFSLDRYSLRAVPPTGRQVPNLWNCQLPVRQHYLSIPYSSNSTCRMCHFLTKPTPAPSPEFFLSDCGPTIPSTTQPGSCRNQL